MYKLLTIFFFVLFIGCESIEKVKKEKEQTKNRNSYKLLVEIQILNHVPNQEAFLLFNYGDTKTIVQDKFQHLKSIGKISTDERDAFTYSLETQLNIIIFTFNTKYSDSGLYELKMVGKSSIPPASKAGVELLFYGMLREVFDPIYGWADHLQKDIFGYQQAYWFNNGTQIYLTHNDKNVIIVYTDLKLKQNEEAKADSLRISKYNDF